MSDDQTGRELRRFLNERIPPASPGLSDRVLAFRAEPRDTPRTHWLVPALAVLLAIALVAALTLGTRLVRPGRVPAGSSGPQVFREGPRTTDCKLPSGPDQTRTGVGPFAFLNDREGWMLTSSYTIPATCGRTASRTELFHTTDGGGHWTAQLLFDGVGQEVHFAPDGNGMVVGVSSQPGPGEGGRPVLYRTADRGAHWEAVTVPGAGAGWGAYTFSDAHTGWLLAYGALDNKADSSLYKTTDGGRSWSTLSFDRRQTFAAPNLQGSLKVWDGRTALFIPGSTSPDSPLTTYTTHDGGSTWHGVELVRPSGMTLSRRVGIIVVPSQGTGAGIALVSQFEAGAPTTPGDLVFATADAGSHWNVAGQAPMTAMAVAALDAGHVWLGTGRDLSTSTDGGRTWSTQKAVLSDGLEFGRLGFTNPAQGWVIAYRSGSTVTAGTLYATSDGGAHWTHVTTPPAPTTS